MIYEVNVGSSVKTIFWMELIFESVFIKRASWSKQRWSNLNRTLTARGAVKKAWPFFKLKYVQLCNKMS